MLKPLATTLSARRQSYVNSGQAQAPFRAILDLLGQREVGVDQVADFSVDVPGEDTQADADLRCGQPRAGSVQHRVGEIGDKLAQFLVEVHHFEGRLAQDRISEESDRLDRHGTPCERDRGRAESRPKALLGRTPAVAGHADPGAKLEGLAA
jgi:hypothetical protein